MLGSRGLRLLAVAGLAIGVVACTAAGPGASGQTTDVQRQAQEALARWDAAVSAGAGGSGFVLVGESTLMVGDDWGPNIDGGNAKMAWGAGLFESNLALSTGTPADAEVNWSDGRSGTVPVVSAQDAFSDMKSAATWPCAECTPLKVISARLTTATFDTSRGPAQAPAWEFGLENTPVKLDHIAVDKRFAPPPAPTVNPDDTGGSTAPWIGPSVSSATVDAGGMTLTVTFTGAPDHGDKPCGADYTAQAFESDNAVVVVVFEHRNPLPVACSAVGAFRIATVTLAKPLGGRTLIDLSAQPLPVSVAR